MGFEQYQLTFTPFFHPVFTQISLYILFFFISPTLFFPFRSEQYRISLTIDKINSKKAEVLGPHCSSWPASCASQTHTSHQHVSQRLRSCVTQKIQYTCQYSKLHHLPARQLEETLPARGCQGLPAALLTRYKI